MNNSTVGNVSWSLAIIFLYLLEVYRNYLKYLQCAKTGVINCKTSFLCMNQIELLCSLKKPCLLPQKVSTNIKVSVKSRVNTT